MGERKEGARGRKDEGIDYFTTMVPAAVLSTAVDISPGGELPGAGGRGTLRRIEKEHHILATAYCECRLLP